LPALAGAHYQLRHYEEAVGIGRRAWALSRNWPAGLRYVVAGLGQLGRIEEAQVALAEMKTLDTDLAFVESNLTRLYINREGVDHFDGLRKAGFEVGFSTTRGMRLASRRQCALATGTKNI
jgi:hypothetical protein